MTMSKISNRYWLLLLVLPFIISFQALKEKKIKVYLIGDSTIALKEEHKYPETGWGIPFQYFFDSSVTVINRAMNGRSTRTFINENRWQPIYDSLQPGDYVLIQFGHNDASKEKTERYTTPEDYKTNLKKFIRETRSKNAIPVLLTPVARRKFDKEGKVEESHPIYAALAREVATEEQLAFIDLNEKSKSLLQDFGEQNSKWLYLQLEPGENPNYPEGIKDNTHFSEMGARKIAQIVLNEIKKLNLGLAAHIYKPEPKKK